MFKYNFVYKSIDMSPFHSFLHFWDDGLTRSIACGYINSFDNEVRRQGEFTEYYYCTTVLECKISPNGDPICSMSNMSR